MYRNCGALKICIIWTPSKHPTYVFYYCAHCGAHVRGCLRECCVANVCANVLRSVAHMSAGDFFASEKSVIMPKADTVCTCVCVCVLMYICIFIPSSCSRLTRCLYTQRQRERERERERHTHISLQYAAALSMMTESSCVCVCVCVFRRHVQGLRCLYVCVANMLLTCC
jgi:hypothetical protein